jgi:hypothetical protein
LTGGVAPVGTAISAALVVLSAIRTAPTIPVPVPATMDDINALIHTQIIYLICFYNKIFGIVARDLIHVCITRFQEFVLDD